MKDRIMTAGDLIFALTRYPDDMPVAYLGEDGHFAFASVNGIKVVDEETERRIYCVSDLQIDSMASSWENPEVYQGKAIIIT